MNWDDLRVLAAIAETGSLSGAGRRLGLNHATVGRRLSALEASLKVKLIDRLPRSSRLTDAGTEVAALAGRMEAAARAVDLRARDHRTDVGGSVSVSAPPFLASAFIAPRLAVLTARFPRLTVVLDGVVNVVSLDRGDADIAVRLAALRPSAHVARVVGEVQLALYATPSVAATPPERWAFISYGDDLSHVPHQQWFRRHVASRLIALRTNDVHSQFAAVRSGLGVAMLPRFAADRDVQLVRVESEARPPASTVCLVSHPDVRRAPAVRAAARHLAEMFTSEPAFSRSRPD
ncbi:MAG TPA: LysR family transcriptional regulator [Myxococcaceae bacterium]|nr:LysR family transcriptional regulator [Myxococcaceae bacterium]